MFNQINGLPAHVLALHAAVVLVPLAALLGVLFAVPRTRSWARVPLLLVALGAMVAVYFARETGQRFQAVLQLQGPVRDLVRQHSQRADVLFVATIGYAVLASAAFLVTRRTRSSALVTAVCVLVVLGAAGVAFQTYRVGDVGTRAVWNPTGQADYGSTAVGD